ncbi:hypothetical protein GW7_20171 [Heterocephalus glaber]|uniref:Uncharacterized protein n=1 Tax=Heterocephalus glaber TaxID=10181 RepID=G5CBG0_HETGA|nr:hypothetical protein GW7_20171 [Heterocephalus glaber]
MPTSAEREVGPTPAARLFAAALALQPETCVSSLSWPLPPSLESSPGSAPISASFRLSVVRLPPENQEAVGSAHHYPRSLTSDSFRSEPKLGPRLHRTVFGLSPKETELVAPPTSNTAFSEERRTLWLRPHTVGLAPD